MEFFGCKGFLSGSLSIEEDVLTISMTLGLEAEEGGGRFVLEPVFFLIKKYKYSKLSNEEVARRD